MDSKTSLIGLDFEALKAQLVEAGVEPKAARMRARQLWNWIYVHGARDFESMTNIAAGFRAELAGRFTLERPEIVSEQISTDGTRKWLLKSGGQEYETVYIPEADRGTLCVSSQVGCTLNCRFCHTGTQKLVRNLTPAEILGQLMVARDQLDDWPSTAEGRSVTNIVMMGMGEPLYNFENVKAALAIVSDGDGLALSRRRVTLSTAGVVPMIKRAGEEIGCALAISLHAVRDEVRDEIVPINRKYKIAELMQACRDYPGASNARRITFEYVMLKGVNDSLADARALVQLVGRHSGQDQSDPVQSLAGRALRMLRLGADRKICRDCQSRRLRLPGAHPARPGHHGRLRPAQKRKPQAEGERPAGGAGVFGAGADAAVTHLITTTCHGPQMRATQVTTDDKVDGTGYLKLIRRLRAGVTRIPRSRGG